MNTAAPMESALLRWLDIDRARVGEPAWLRAARAAAAGRARHQGAPTQKSEGWRYTGLRALIEAGFLPHPQSIADVPLEDLDAHLIPSLDSHRLIMINGRLDPRLSQLADLPQGVHLGGLAHAISANPHALSGLLGQIAGDGQHLFTSLNTAAFDDGLLVQIDAGVLVQRPIELVHLSIGLDESHVAHPRHLIALGEGAQAELIERYLSVGDARYCNNAVIELHLARGAALAHDRVQNESRNAFHLSGLYLRQEADSRYRGVNIGLGGTWSRTDLVTEFSAPGADCALLGLYLAGDRQLIDYHMDVRHQVPDCASRENFKGILHGQGKAVFDGRVYVAVDAQRTDAAMSNRNLILSPNAEIDTKPQLEIHADDVKCSHGTTVGQLEPDQLFYLRSRGLSAAFARRLLCHGFASEIIDNIGAEALREQLAESLGQRLET